MPDWGSICGRKQSSLMGALQIVGTSLGGHSMPDCCKALMREEEGVEKGRQQELFFPVTLPTLPPIPLHPLLLQCCSSVSHTLSTSAPLRGSLLAVHPQELAQSRLKMCWAFLATLQNKWQTFLQLVSIGVLIKLNSCGAHMDVICKSHCSCQIKANGEISLLSPSCSSELLCIHSIHEILISVDMREYQSWWQPWEVLVILVNLWGRYSGARLRQTHFHVLLQSSTPHL